MFASIHNNLIFVVNTVTGIIFSLHDSSVVCDISPEYQTPQPYIVTSMSLLPGAGGECGSQHEDKTCLPMQGRSCCSINGYCGSNETYCFESNGCQSGCVDPVDFYNTSSAPFVTVATISESADSTAISTSQLTTISTSTLPPRSTSGIPVPSGSSIPSSNSTSTTHKQGLHGAARTGAIAGGTVAGVLLLLFVACLIIYFRRYRSRPSRAPSGSSGSTTAAAPMRDVSGYNRGANAPQDFQIRERGE
ncbi:hypothetical protein BKA65DRAFT_537767 [Rhexocercosporidium sp. MPI-PUGE-AT-0058]|nr:hypothetical protein BKA65DRAFT_537767 [Rhexocercosporidium sp. MPI-PUGE-AT-0058]